MLPSINLLPKYAAVISLSVLIIATGYSQSTSDAFHVKRTNDFEVSGDGTNKAWDAAQWMQLPITQGEDTRETKVKALYSATGVYFLFYNQDNSMTASKTTDFDKLWMEDVAEVFLWPDTTQTIYFEYEISPLNYELPILIPNFGGKFLGWLPWQYSGDRKTRHMTGVSGGEKKNGSALKAWTAEFFIPYKLMTPLGNVPPRPGTTWRMNFYRVDYDNNKVIEWSWKKTETTFHEFKKFGRFIFD